MFSVLSPSGRSGELEFAVQLITGGLVSPGLYELKEGDTLQIRGPHGLLFVWHPNPDPLVLIGGGSGIAPLIPIYEQHRQLYPGQPIVFIMSAKTPGHILDHDKWKDVLVTRFTGNESRMDQAFIAEKAGHMAFLPGVRCFVCGPAIDFVQDISQYLVMAGFPQHSIKTERYY
jgi:ferredoxin-NADP reductase